MDNQNQRRLPPLDQNNSINTSHQKQRSETQRQIIASNEFQSKASLQNKLTQAAQIEELDSFICYFCGGTTCKKEIYTSNKNINAIEGLHSDWITDNILAMQRLHQKDMTKILQQFQLHNIGAVINLQQQGEHAGCGPGILPNVGFSYNPESLQSGIQDNLIKARISFFNFGWEDMTSDTTFSNLLKICSAFEFTLKAGKKVAVHCHAGTGRTGVGIVSWLIFGERMNADDAIKLFQSKRLESLGKTSQKDLLKNFEKYLQGRKWFDYPLISGLNNETIIKQQNVFTINEIKNNTKNIPGPFYIIFKKFNTLLDDKLLNPQIIMKSFVGDSENLQYFSQEDFQQLKKQFDSHNYQIGHVTDLRIFCQILYYYLDNLPHQCISDKCVFLIKQQLNNKSIQEIIEIIKDELDFCTFSLLKLIIQFANKLQMKDKNINLKLYFYRFSISLLQKRSFLDDNFLGHALIRIEKIQIVQIFILNQFLQKWCDELQNNNIENIFEDNELSKSFRRIKGM